MCNIMYIKGLLFAITLPFDCIQPQKYLVQDFFK